MAVLSVFLKQIVALNRRHIVYSFDNKMPIIHKRWKLLEV